MKKKIKASIIIVICLLIGIGTTVLLRWAYESFGNLSLDEIVFHLKVPMEGTNTEKVWEGLREFAVNAVIPVIILSTIMIYPMFKNVKFIKKIKTAESEKTIKVNVRIATAILIISVINLIFTTELIQYIFNQINVSQFIANEYVNPEETEIKFPEQKRNLIYIFLESMETSYSAKADGGLSNKNLIPEITKLSKENIDFSTTSEIGGAHTAYGSTWTVGAMTAQTTGVPLKISIEENSLGAHSIFLGGAHSIGEVLEDNGYHNFLLLGSYATFGGRKSLFIQHGNYEIWDFESALEEKRVKEKIWWGYTDDKLFEFAKEKITNLSKEEEPFNFTMLTADTHFTDGYKCKDCPNSWDEQYKNVISCSSKKVGEFIEWIKKQDFYENTTIVISGDHLTMQANFLDHPSGENLNKKVVSMIINPAIEAEEKNRKYTTFDLYPTTLAALGAEIEGDKLALGTNLFSEEQTLVEKYGLEYVNKELSKTSKFYNNKILVTE